MSAIDLKAKRAELQKISVDAKALYARMETEVAERTPENQTAFEKMIEAGKAKRAEIERIETLNELDAATATDDPAVGAKGGGPSEGGAAQPFQGGKSWGAVVLESPQFKTASQNWSEGRMGRVKVGGIKAITSTPAAGGYLYRPDRQTEIIDTARQRPFSLLDIVNVQQTSVDSIEYVEMSSRTNNAAIVPELDTGRTHVTAGAGITAEMIAADLGNFGENFAMKPKGDLAFAPKSALVKTIAQWIPCSRQILADAPRLRGMIDQELTYMLRLALEDLIVSANATGFVGLLNAPNVQTRTHKVSGRAFAAGDKIADTLRKALTDIQLAFYEADSLIVSPQVAEALELEKDNEQRYLMTFDPVAQRIWRKPVVISNALNGANAGTAIVGNMALAATLWDREDVQVRVGEPGNFFLENAVAVLAELRAAFAVVRAMALEKVLALI